MFSSGIEAWTAWGDFARSLYSPGSSNGQRSARDGAETGTGQKSYASAYAFPWLSALQAYQEYCIDSAQRSVLFWDVFRRRANNALEHHESGKPPLLAFEHEMVLDARTLERPANYALLRILPPAGASVDAEKRPYLVIDPRAGHGPGIGGFKEDSEIGEALRAGHPVYFVTFFAEPMPGQLLSDVVRAEMLFVEKVRELHPRSEKPAIIGNCQAGWATAILAAAVPKECGPIVLAGAPLSYWAGKRGENPMRYRGGLSGGSWAALMLADLGGGKFDGAYLVENFEGLNPANTYWSKNYNLYSNVDTEGERFLEFERWWNGMFVMNADEFRTIVDDLFIGNKLAKGELTTADGVRIDMRNIKSPIVIFCSWGDNITPPQQALNWILDLYADAEEIKAHEQTIVYNVHQNIGHLGIFVSGKIAKKEHSEIIDNLDLIELLPPGLYEMTLTPKKAGASGEFVRGAYETTFHERTLDAIRAFDDGRDDEEPFEVVERVSAINGALYERFLAPPIRALSSDASAQALRQMHPARVRRLIWSDTRNPFMAPVAGWAEQVRQNRKPAADDNPFLALERRVSELIVAQLNAYRDQRDRLSEVVFTSVYTQPWLRAAVGLPPAGAAAADRPRAQHANGRREEHERRRALILARAAEGSALDAFVRALLYVRDDFGPLHERGYRTLEAIVRESPEIDVPSDVRLKEAVRDQYFLLALDRRNAFETLPQIVPDAETRAKIVAALHRLGERITGKDPGVKARIGDVERALGVAGG